MTCTIGTYVSHMSSDGAPG